MSDKKLILFTPELWAAIDHAATGSRSGWLERELWRLKSIRDAATELNIKNPQRPLDSRGGNRADKN